MWFGFFKDSKFEFLEASLENRCKPSFVLTIKGVFGLPFSWRFTERINNYQKLTSNLFIFLLLFSSLKLKFESPTRKPQFAAPKKMWIYPFSLTFIYFDNVNIWFILIVMLLFVSRNIWLRLNFVYFSKWILCI